MLPIYLVILGAHVLWTLALTFIPNHAFPLNYYYNLASGLFFLLPLLQTLRAYRRTSPLGPALPLWTISFLSLTIAQLVWSYYNIFTQTNAPFPGVGDVFWLTFYPCQLAILLVVNNNIKLKWNLETIITFVFLVSIFTFFTTSFLFLSLDLTQPLLTNLLSFAYPFADALLAALGLTLLQNQRASGSRYLSFFTFAYFLFMVGDVLFAYTAGNQTYWNGNFVDLIAVAGRFFIALAAVEFLKPPPENNLSASPTQSAS